MASFGMAPLRTAFCHGLSSYRPSSAVGDRGARCFESRHHELKRASRRQQEALLRAAFQRPESAPRVRKKVDVEGWAPSALPSQQLQQLEANFRRDHSMRQAHEQLLQCWQTSRKRDKPETSDAGGREQGEKKPHGTIRSPSRRGCSRFL